MWQNVEKLKGVNTYVRHCKRCTFSCPHRNTDTSSPMFWGKGIPVLCVPIWDGFRQVCSTGSVATTGREDVWQQTFFTLWVTSLVCWGNSITIADSSWKCMTNEEGQLCPWTPWTCAGGGGKVEGKRTPWIPGNNWCLQASVWPEMKLLTVLISCFKLLVKLLDMLTAAPTVWAFCWYDLWIKNVVSCLTEFPPV